MKIFDNVLRGYYSYMTHLGRASAREVLLNSSDRMLEDAGFSRELLESGVKAWPWHKAVSEHDPLHFRRIGNADLDAHAVRELQNYNDKEPNDLGISRGSVSDAVMPGRDGIENNCSERKVA